MYKMEFHLSKFIQYLYISCKLITVLSENAVIWDNHAYTGRHFDALVTATQVGPPNVIKPALLILYNSKCEDKLKNLRKNILPGDHLMVLAKHDYEKFPKWIWYKFDERDNLAERYQPIRNCPEYLFFKKGSTLSEPEIYDESRDKNVMSWIYDRIKVTFKVINKRGKPIEINFMTTMPKSQGSHSINPGQTVELESYIANFIVVMEENDFVFAKLIDSSFPAEVIISDEDAINRDLYEWLSDAKLEMTESAAKSVEWKYNLAMSYLMNFKLPVILPRFTEVGYHKDKIPTELYEKLLTFYIDNEQNRIDEINTLEPFVNDAEVKCGMVQVDNDNLNLINEYMRPLLEEWSNCSLLPTATYGIREYYTGNMLRNHVDRISTHVIAVIFQISKNLGEQEDWSLEIIDFDGVRKLVYLEPGEMLYYESGTVIHGRPEPFKGIVFANLFIHYQPMNNWDWDNVDGYITKSGEVIDESGAITPIKEKFPNRVKYHDEL